MLSDREILDQWLRLQRRLRNAKQKSWREKSKDAITKAKAALYAFEKTHGIPHETKKGRPPKTP